MTSSELGESGRGDRGRKDLAKSLAFDKLAYVDVEVIETRYLLNDGDFSFFSLMREGRT